MYRLATRLAAGLAAVLLVASCATTTRDTPEADGFSYNRTYESGNTYRFHIERRYSENGVPKHVENAASVHTVVGEHPHSEEIAFESLIKTSSADGSRIDLSKEIAAFPAYRVSLAKPCDEKSLELPSIEGWDMSTIGVLTDLHTFLVAISPQVGSDRLAEQGDVYRAAEPVKGSWANGTAIPVGEDCIHVEVALDEVGPEIVKMTTRFMPPEKSCLDMIAAWMNEPVVEGTPNNFQQKIKNGDAYIVMWGREEFTIRSTVRRSDGMLLAATMDNLLTLQLGVQCSEDLMECEHKVPHTIRRELSLRVDE